MFWYLSEQIQCLVCRMTVASHAPVVPRFAIVGNLLVASFENLGTSGATNAADVRSANSVRFGAITILLDFKI